jgi:hypothetical protein
MRYLLFVLLAACTTEVSTTSAALSDDPVTSCPVVDPTAIAGHEATFYACAEQTLHCGPSGYLIGYGTKYAERFYRKTRPWMSPAGRQWIDDVLVCLQDELRASIDSETSCPDVRTIAFDTHPDCYVAAGFCDLPFLDWLAVFTTVDATDWFSADALRQVRDVAHSCL